MNLGIGFTLQKLHDRLPRNGEEGGEHTVVSLDDIFCGFSGEERVFATPVILLVQRIFTLLGLLDTHYLDQNAWRFVSFPASLMARSIITSLMDDEQSLFESGFWNPSDSNAPVSDQQRAILHTLESSRLKNHKAAAAPIRYVHVAWGLVVIDGKVLLRHREDRHRPNRNNYVLVGGRLSTADLKQADPDISHADALRMLQSPQAASNGRFIETALRREVNEETGLQLDQHYSYEHWRTLQPYTAVEGAGANHALTEYRIHVYHLKLNLEGVLALSKRCKNDASLNWFSLREFENAKTVDGKMAYIDALVEDYASTDEWQTVVNTLAPSYLPTYPFNEEVHAITLTQSMEHPLLYGKTGKEHPIDLALDQQEYSVLKSLCSYAKDPTCRIASDAIKAMPCGWLEISDPALQACVAQLALKLQQARCPIVEGYKEQYYRIALAPEFIFFDEDLFSYSLNETPMLKTELIVTRDELVTELVALEKTSVKKLLSSGLSKGLKNVESAIEMDLGIMESFNKGLRRDLGPVCRSLGLRRIIRTSNNTPRIAITYASTE